MVASYLSAFNLTSLNKTVFFFLDQNWIQTMTQESTLSQVLSVFADDSRNEFFNVYHSFDKDTQIC